MGNVQKMIDFAINWCNDNSHGYDQGANRWGPDCDCSSLMYMAAHHAGYNIKTGSGYTGSMRRDFSNAGFKVRNFTSLSDLKPGEILVNEGSHTEMFIGNGQFAGAHINENGGITGGRPGDQTGREVSIGPAYIYSGGWDIVLTPPDGTGSGNGDGIIGGGDSSGSSSSMVSIYDLAKDVIAGKYGNGEERKKKLGSKYEAVQQKVNEILGGKPSVDIDALARRAIRGEFGNGAARRKALGSYYDAVQKRINEILS